MNEYHSVTIEILSGDVPPYLKYTAAQSTVVPWNRNEYPLLEQDSDCVGERLFSLVAERSYMGVVPLEIWLFTQQTIHIVRLEKPPFQVLFSALSGMQGVEQMAVLGNITKRERGQQHSMVHVHVEDQQGRWWFGAQALNPEGMVVFDEPAASRVTEDGKPIGVGGWFAHSRRRHLHSVVRALLEN